MRHKGYTLVEVLLALSLMGMLLALAYGGLRASTKATDKGQAVLEYSGRVRMAHQFVRKQINQIVPLAFADESLGDRIVFTGDANKIRYVAPMPGYLGFGGPQVQELAIVRSVSGEGNALVLNHALLQGFEEAKLYEREPIVLIEDIDFAQFSFLGRDEFDNLAPWMNVWDTPEILPEAVALDVEFTEDIYIKWPPLTASVKIDGDALLELLNPAEPSETNMNRAIQEMINKRKQQ